MAISLAPKQAALSIDFVIIGGGLAGLACAVALRRVGHRVLVLEQTSSIYSGNQHGCRIPPNFSKILYHWGLRDELAKIGMKSEGLDLLLLDSGEVLGTHIWDEELLRETRGNWIFAHYCDVRQLLYKTAIWLGAKIRFNARVTAIHPEIPRVQLATGELIKADVVVGADGASGLSRQFLIEDDESERPPRVVVYSTTVPKEAILADKDLRYIYGHDENIMFSWFGNGNAVLGFPIGGKKDLAMVVYAQADSDPDDHDDDDDDQGPATPSASSPMLSPWSKSPLENMQKAMEPCEQRVRKLGALARPPSCAPMIEHPGLENWVEDSGRMVLIGEAAHPLPPGCIQQCAMTIEDGAVLAKLFSHLRAHEQITNFLYAFQDLRQPRCQAVYKKELGDVGFMTLPPGPYQQGRDAALRANRDAGRRDVLGGSGEDDEGNPLWGEIKDIFGYDAEDEADDWWIGWGLLRERANGMDLSLASDVMGSLGGHVEGDGNWEQEDRGIVGSQVTQSFGTWGGFGMKVETVEVEVKPEKVHGLPVVW